jgi:hypothetical protein
MERPVTVSRSGTFRSIGVRDFVVHHRSVGRPAWPGADRGCQMRRLSDDPVLFPMA